MNDRKDGITVVIPTYNRIDPLKRAVESVKTSAPERAEIIVVDDCSEVDPSEFIAPVNSSGVPVRIYRMPRNGGPQAARNLGVRRARYELIAFLDSDDFFHESKIDSVMRLHAANGFDIACHRQCEMPKNHLLLNAWRKWFSFLPFRWILTISNPIQTSALIVRRTHRLGPPSMRHSEDYAFLVNFVRRGTKAVYMPQVLGGIGRPQGTAGGLSSASWKMRKGEFIAKSLWWRRPSFGAACRIAIGTAFGMLRVANDLLRGRYGPLA